MKNIKGYYKFLVLMFILLLGLAGCGTDQEKNEPSGEMQLEPIEVSIQLPEKIDPGKEIEIKSTVIQGDTKVEDADEVKFEIWKDGSEQHEELLAEHVGDGVYSIHKTFETDGTYYVISHVTAKGMHTMPKEQFTVGNPENHASMEDHHSDEHLGDGQHEHHEDSTSKEHQHGHGLTIDLLTDETIKANKDVTLTAEVKKEQPLTEAHVQFEILKENTGEEEKQWVAAEETTEGTYEGQTNFKETGNYLITVHVMKGELHDHYEQVITVK